VDQAANELLRLGVDDLSLPLRKRDLAPVLRTRAVLGEEAGPGFGVAADDLETRRVKVDDRDSGLNHQRLNRIAAFRDQPRIARIEGDLEPPHAPRLLQQAAVAEIHAEGVGVRSCGQTKDVVVTTAFRASRHRRTGKLSAEPVPDGAARYARRGRYGG
jgi:hypothetical protein